MLASVAPVLSQSVSVARRKIPNQMRDHVIALSIQATGHIIFRMVLAIMRHFGSAAKTNISTD